jgi:hypothetical protein
MIEASMTVNTVQFEAAMQRLKQGVRSGFIDPQYGLLPTQARLLAARCQTFTPPQNVGQGRVKVAMDITNIFRPLSQTTFDNKAIKKIIRTDNRPEWDKLAVNLRGVHNLRGTRASSFYATTYKDRSRLTRGRSAKYGNIGYVTLGGEAQKVRKLIAQKKGMVGWARAGWNQGIISFGGKVEDKWVSKHGLGHGSAINGTSSPDPWIQVGNETGWARHSNEGGRIIRNAIVARSRDMEAYFNRMMRLAAQKADPQAA